jgi:hypothetical protein
MHLENCLPAIVSYNIMIGKALNDTAACDQLFDELKRRGLQPDVVTFTSMILAHSVDANRVSSLFKMALATVPVDLKLTDAMLVSKICSGQLTGGEMDNLPPSSLIWATWIRRVSKSPEHAVNTLILSKFILIYRTGRAI